MGWFQERAEARHIEHQEAIKKQSEAAWLRVAQMHSAITTLEFNGCVKLTEAMRAELTEYVKANIKVLRV